MPLRQRKEARSDWVAASRGAPETEAARRGLRGAAATAEKRHGHTVSTMEPFAPQQLLVARLHCVARCTGISQPSSPWDNDNSAKNQAGRGSVPGPRALTRAQAGPPPTSIISRQERLHHIRYNMTDTIAETVTCRARRALVCSRWRRHIERPALTQLREVSTAYRGWTAGRSGGLFWG